MHLLLRAFLLPCAVLCAVHVPARHQRHHSAGEAANQEKPLRLLDRHRTILRRTHHSAPDSNASISNVSVHGIAGENGSSHAANVTLAILNTTRRGNAGRQLLRQPRVQDDAMSLEAAEKEKKDDKGILGLPKLAWALLLAAVAMLVYLLCIPFILALAKRRPRPAFSQ
eukprot:TRINITY_DN103483_c0_g1_i1.p1 TRINITY_DN103483_c0_g1~~TRINITY_DN103483_c0_g1_i1.p1  ORF type:complete len:169 (-),score=19.40 TRINITY_DN103483_c0_g1_i1:186-692(-)